METRVWEEEEEEEDDGVGGSEQQRIWNEMVLGLEGRAGRCKFKNGFGVKLE